MSLEGLIVRTAAKRRNAEEIVGATLVDQTAKQALQSSGSGAIEPGGPKDDGEPPPAPAGVTATPLPSGRKLAVSWDVPPASDYVKTTVVEVTPPSPPGAAAQLFEARTENGVVFIDAPRPSGEPSGGPEPQTVRVWHRDLWGRTSAPFGPVNATPAQNTVDFLVADRILAGNIDVALSVTAGGQISAGGARMDDGGLTLLETATELTAPDIDRGAKITPAGASPFAAVQFFKTPSGAGSTPRGIHLRVDGPGSGDNPAVVRVEAAGNGNVSGNRAARIIVRGGSDETVAQTRVSVEPWLRVVGGITFDGDLIQADSPFGVSTTGVVTAQALVSAGGNINQQGTPFLVNDTGGLTAAVLQSEGAIGCAGNLNVGANATIAGLLTAEKMDVQYKPAAASAAASGGAATFTHNRGVAAAMVYAEVQQTGGWHPLPHPGGQIFVDQSATNLIRVRNNTATAQTVRVRAIFDA